MLKKSAVVVALTAWAGFCAWCVSGFPPAVDLPAHAAQIQTLADLVFRMGPVAAYYRPSFPIGYGLTTWLFAPLAFVTDGAAAARVAVWLALFLLPIAHASLAHAMGRSAWVAVLAAPFAFGISYWYGFVPTLFALPWTVFGWALFITSVDAAELRGSRLAALALLATAVMLTHVVVFAAFAVGIAALTLSSIDRRRASIAAMVALCPAFLISASRLVSLAERAVGGQSAPTEYDLSGHFNWLLKAYDTDGRIALWSAVLMSIVFVAAYLRDRCADPARRRALYLFVAMILLYAVTPKSISGAWLVHVRFAVLIGLAALLLVDMSRLPRPTQVVVVVLCAVSVVTAIRRHHRFSQAVEGLEAITRSPPPEGIHGGFSVEGLALPGSRIKFVEHLPQWWTARHGGVGTHFFADADHQPVRFRDGLSLPTLVVPEQAPVDALAAFIVFGEGALPPQFDSFVEVQRAGRWRRFERDQK